VESLGGSLIKTLKLERHDKSIISIKIKSVVCMSSQIFPIINYQTCVKHVNNLKSCVKQNVQT